MKSEVDMLQTIGKIDETIVAECAVWKKKGTTTMKTSILKNRRWAGAVAACLCLAVIGAAGVGIYQKQLTKTYESYDLVCTDGFKTDFFRLKGAVDTGDTGMGIWANPLRTAELRLSMTLRQETEEMKPTAKIAVAVSGITAAFEDAGAEQIYAYLASQNVETGIIDGIVYAVVTPEQIDALTEKVSSQSEIGLLFSLAQPSEAQKNLENSIRY